MARRPSCDAVNGKRLFCYPRVTKIGLFCLVCQTKKTDAIGMPNEITLNYELSRYKIRGCLHEKFFWAENRWFIFQLSRWQVLTLKSCWIIRQFRPAKSVGLSDTAPSRNKKLRRLKFYHRPKSAQKKVSENPTVGKSDTFCCVWKSHTFFCGSLRPPVRFFLRKRVKIFQNISKTLQDDAFLQNFFFPSTIEPGFFFS